MGTTAFLALQCYQCSTMQVKQQKKSSNKWTCVVCNQKQSVRKVFAQSFMAKDIRLFVQSYNMSRKSAEEDQTLAPDYDYDYDCEDQALTDLTDQRKRRTDWTEYREPDISQKSAEEEEGDGSESRILTEFPKELFKKPKLSSYAERSCHREGSSQLVKPKFSKRNVSKQDLPRDEFEPEIGQIADDYEPEIGQTADEYQPEIGNSHSIDYLKKKMNLNLKPSSAKGTSKWSCYITQEEGFPPTERFEDDGSSVFEINANELKVDDDIHPDFL